jgi:predicted dehydrogenase
MTSEHADMNRRGFLLRAGQGMALAGTALAMAGGAQARGTVRRADPHAPKTGRLLKEDETIGIGIIGRGGMGGGHLREILEREKRGEKVQVRGIADPYKRRQLRGQGEAQEIVNRNVDIYFDYRKLLERDDIHGVVIATPDHWHAQCSIDAMLAGKDVYCQKPVTLTIEESLKVRDTALETGRVFQCGAQNCSDDWFWQARKFIKDGGIGEIIYAQADYSRNSGSPENPMGGEWNYKIDPDASDNPAAGEAYIDWKQWLGPAPKRPFSQHRFFQFRKYWDYSGGIATDLMYHYLAPLIIALDAKAPERAMAGGGIFVQHDDREVPDTFLVTLDFPDDYSILMTSSMANSQGNPAMIRGHRATIRPADGGMKVTAEPQFKDWFKGKYGAEEIFVAKEPRPGHMDKWLECMRTREETHCTAETAYRAMAGVKMACDSYRQEKFIFWDNEKEKYARKHPRPNRSSKFPA